MDAYPWTMLRYSPVTRVAELCRGFPVRELRFPVVATLIADHSQHMRRHANNTLYTAVVFRSGDGSWCRLYKQQETQGHNAKFSSRTVSRCPRVNFAGILK